MGSEFRTTRTMRNRANVTFEFVSAWLDAHPGAGGPSLDEIAEGTGTDKNGAQAAVRVLKRQGRLVGTPGVARSLRRPGETEQVLAQLRALGWTVNPELRAADPPPAPVTFLTLPLLAPNGQTAGGG